MEKVESTQIELKELLREPGEPFRHMAPSAPSTAPLGLYVCCCNGSIWSYTTHCMISMHRMAAKGSDLAPWNIAPSY